MMMMSGLVTSMGWREEINKSPTWLFTVDDALSSFRSGEEKKRAEAPSAADLEDDLVGGKIPRTLLKVRRRRRRAGCDDNYSSSDSP